MLPVPMKCDAILGAVGDGVDGGDGVSMCPCAMIRTHFVCCSTMFGLAFLRLCLIGSCVIGLLASSEHIQNYK